MTSLPPLIAFCRSVVVIVELPGSTNAVLREPPVDPPAAPVTMVTSVGSSNHKPLRPNGAWVDTLMPSTRSRWPEVSMRPPSPPLMPPSARRVPATEVTPVGWPKSLQATTVPPLPLLVALASSTAPDSTVVVRAWPREGWLFCQLPPTKIWPPPPSPRASSWAPAFTLIWGA